MPSALKPVALGLQSHMAIHLANYSCLSYEQGFIVRKVLQGQQKWSGYSCFGQTSFSQCKNEIPFLQKQVVNKSAIMTLGLLYR